ncbi:hypothetical protein [Streptomyces iconiensis]|uniref:Uncharacterized protein n=1 Tax=Streptomyces iconiensis TaxID=1384038 RepID=A0ABT6ZYU7_9ACTN|nr:hypothetical protein [Streptomyces iconiensis]MDJ1134242.1 hypothetical protein [Streptomyces iconiensis]
MSGGVGAEPAVAGPAEGTLLGSAFLVLVALVALVAHPSVSLFDAS